MTELLINGKTTAFCHNGDWICGDDLIKDYCQAVSDYAFMTSVDYVFDAESSAVLFVQREASKTNSVVKTIEVVSAPTIEHRNDVVY